MPSKDTKVISIRIPKDEYYDWLALASINKQPISVYLKSCLDISKAPEIAHKPLAKAKKNIPAFFIKFNNNINNETASVVYFPSIDDEIIDPDMVNNEFAGFWLQSFKHSILDRHYQLVRLENFGLSEMVKKGNGRIFYSKNQDDNWTEIKDAEIMTIPYSSIYDKETINGKLVRFKLKF